MLVHFAASEAACRAACSARADCRFFTVYRDAQRRGSRSARLVSFCSLCAACDYTDVDYHHLRVIAAHRHYRSRAIAYASFVKTRSPAEELVRQRTVTAAALHDIQGAYSTAVYGAPGRVDLHALRVVYLRLLSDAAVRSVARVGVCHKTARPPRQPFYWAHAVSEHSPLDTLWVRPARPERPFPNGSWVEVTHCPWADDRDETTHAMFLYYAAGSGLSINLGRTLVVPRVPGNRDFVNGEARTEIIWLRRAECEALRPTDEGVMCGRHPHLFRCDANRTAAVTCGARNGDFFSRPYRRRGLPGLMPHFLNGHQPPPGASRGELQEANRSAAAGVGFDQRRLHTKCASSCFPDALPGGGWSRESFRLSAQLTVP
ncbi:hypothetical protein EMIHUDRAFT_209625 [Emiliania huxleyi CCMP1516]|uniref:Apple domain-containing protein n=2 Tax=Emiliania huxleyi TaxID=2903 RepID=A0A0D3J2G5_EMIH1|nr:hypothetical protein EMIHUDRAFT_209625 [Emiliania huxleyi CCMP1516]EOD17700.1 hypothetical protein EMIHUDRAFT_209625 [Emiliania huxleyi CCMP1516]|eukprot:XP_005770129.1 hypothetical protein EMIHUDRAFT_209625 [Emiliania huxleyi CCMP1516]